MRVLSSALVSTRWRGIMSPLERFLVIYAFISYLAASLAASAGEIWWGMIVLFGAGLGLAIVSTVVVVIKTRPRKTCFAAVRK